MTAKPRSSLLVRRERRTAIKAPAGGRVRRAWERAHYPVVMLVFAVNGSLAAFLGQRLLNDVVGVDGSLWSGPWGFRLAYVALITPLYSALLMATGALFGKGAYFRRRVRRVWGLILPIRPLRE